MNGLNVKRFFDHIKKINKLIYSILFIYISNNNMRRIQREVFCMDSIDGVGPHASRYINMERSSEQVPCLPTYKRKLTSFWNMQ